MHVIVTESTCEYVYYYAFMCDICKYYNYMYSCTVTVQLCIYVICMYVCMYVFMYAFNMYVLMCTIIIMYIVLPMD